jgi:riboflavin kinase, archaea type
MSSEKDAIIGVIEKGLGEGKYFMSMPHYKKEIKKKLKFNPYPGTLNLKVAKSQRDLIKKQKKIRIKGYKKGNKVFGGAYCCKASIEQIEGAIIAPDITKHKVILEFIAPVHIKSALKLRNKSKIKIKVK